MPAQDLSFTSSDPLESLPNAQRDLGIGGDATNGIRADLDGLVMSERWGVEHAGGARYLASSSRGSPAGNPGAPLSTCMRAEMLRSLAMGYCELASRAVEPAEFTGGPRPFALLHTHVAHVVCEIAKPRGA
jgi:hypothetical protein